MPNSLNKIFQHFREKQKQRNLNKDNNQKKDLFHDEFTQINLINNLNNNKKGLGVGGCCSRKTSSSIPSGDQQTLKKNSWTGRKNSDQLFCLLHSEQLFHDALLCRVFDAVESPFDLIRLRRVCKKAAEYVKNKISCVTELDVRRVKFETLSATSTTSSCSLSNSCSADNNCTSAIVEGELWHTHPSGCKVLGRITNLIMEEEDKEEEKSDKKDPKFRLEILVDEQWTSREIAVLCSLIGEFRINLNRISLDAPIFELIVAKLASIDLDRWFAYQCFVKAVDECQMNAALNKLAAQLQQQQASSFLNYGVRSNLVMDKRQLNCFSLQVCVKDANRAALGVAQRPKQLVRNLYHFRCWAGSPGFDERFSQQWKAVNSRAA